MSTTEHQGLRISLVPVLVGFIAGAPAGALMKAAEVATRYSSRVLSTSLEGRAIVSSSTLLAGWQPAEHISEDDFDTACIITLELLEDWGPLTAEQLTRFATAENIATK
ncbi:hypothetical protein ACX80E_04840 [Arthrobacter sp. TMN-49]